MTTGSSDFAPTLHNITPERVVFIYNTDCDGSLDVAQYYQTKRGLPDENLIPLSIPVPVQGTTSLDCESTILDEADYLYYIEIPLLAALENLGTDFSTDGDRSIWVIVLGFGIPIAFDDDGEKIAVASRLNRLGHNTSNKYPNHSYDRQIFQFFNDSDATQLFITAVLDGPNTAAVKKLIDRSLDVDNQTFITGDVVIDPYGLKTSSDDFEYQDDILNFISIELPELGLDSQLTVDIDDPYSEPTVAYLSHDSFYWGWFNPSYSAQLLLNQNERRVFLYNADDRSACNLHFYKNASPFDENGSDFWCNIAINASPGYAACAGSVDNPGSDAFLRPIPFFKSLHQGATLGEAFLFASKYISWKTVLIGDPLMVVNFPVDLPSEQNNTYNLIAIDEVIRLTKHNIETSLAWAARQSRLLSDLKARVVSSTDMTEEVDLLHPITNWEQSKNESAQTNLYFPILSSWARYIRQTTNKTVAQWLEDNDEKVTSYFHDILLRTGSKEIDDDYIYSSGYWEYEWIFEHNELTLENLFFRIEICRNDDFVPASILHTINSYDSIVGWFYEGQLNLFIQMPSSGLSSNFSGRRIRFVSSVSDYLIPTEIYYLRRTTLNNYGTPLLDTEHIERIIIGY